ncbi:MAG: nucleotidyltransferase family protein, partial [Thermoplasmata archaeon]
MTEHLPPTVVILAGGESRRFGGDKLRASIEGTPVLRRVMERVAPLATRVAVAVVSEQRAQDLRPLLPEPAEFLIDQPQQWGAGPGGAIATGLARIPSGPVLFVPGDIPWIETAALAEFLDRATATENDVAAPCWESGETEHLLQWHRDAAKSAQYLPRGSPRSTNLRASEFLRAAPRTLLVPISRLTRRPLSFAHVTRPSDLARPRFRGRPGPARDERLVVGEPKVHYRAAHHLLSIGENERARQTFVLESEWYGRAGFPLLASHAMRDAMWINPRPAQSTPPEQRVGRSDR